VNMSIEFLGDISTRIFNIYSKNIDFIEIRGERSFGTIISTENTLLKQVNYINSIGAGVRVLDRGNWGIASTNDTTYNSLKKSVEEAISMTNAMSREFHGEDMLSDEKTYRDRRKVPMKKSFLDISLDEKKKLIVSLDKVMKNYDSRIISTRVFYYEVYRYKFYANSFGSEIIQEFPNIFLVLTAIAREADKIQTYFDIVGGQYGYEIIEGDDLNKRAISVAENAVKLLSAETIKGGELPVIMDGKVSGTFAHEVFGHASEADNVLNAKSFLRNLVGKKIGSDKISIIDDATIPGAYGSYFYDDEGVPAQRKILLENGVLKGYLHNRVTAYKMNTRSTGNGRAQYYGSRIYVRMSNTFIPPGKWNLEEMIENIDYGVLVEGSSGGMEDPVGGGFQVSAIKARLIEHGRITKLLRNISISGKALDILKNVEAVGKEFVLEPGSCGKGYAGDMVPVTTGGPHVLVRKMIVGVGK
ncbi:MAG: TldD/PmbA family protein, partial [Thermoprotei archaeon]